MTWFKRTGATTAAVATGPERIGRTVTAAAILIGALLPAAMKLAGRAAARTRRGTPTKIASRPTRSGDAVGDFRGSHNGVIVPGTLYHASRSIWYWAIAYR